MAKQTYIAVFLAGDGKQLHFERFGYKNTTTIIKKLTELFTGHWSFVYKDIISETETMEIYATPDGYTREKSPTITMLMKGELLK